MARQNERVETVPIHKRIKENLHVVRDRLGVGITFDIGIREMEVADKEVAVVYCNGLSNSDVMVLILKLLAELKRTDLSPHPFKELLNHYMTHVQVNSVKTIDEAIDFVLTGLFILFIDGSEEAIVLDARKYPTRSPEEPDTERVVRGARDGFTETLAVNTALTRRRLRDERFRAEVIQVGERSKTDVAVVYLQDVADIGLVSLLREKISDIRVDGLPMAEKSVMEFLVKQTWNPFPLVRFTERPDVAAAHLLEGHVLIYVDTSPSIMITPTTYFHHVQHAEEYRQTPITGAYLRWVRFFGIIASLFLIPLWYLYVEKPDLVPQALDFIGLKEKSGAIPVFFQFIFAEIGIDLMRMAAIHTPSPLATAMGLIAAVLIGDIAIKVGLFAPEVILYLSLAAIGLFATPSYELSLANRLIRIFLLLMVYLFKLPGFVIGVTFILLFLIMTRSLNTPYFWPFIPFNLGGMVNVLVRMSIPSMRNRLSIVRPRDDIRSK